MLGVIAEEEGNQDLARKHWSELLADYPASAYAEEAKTAMISASPAGPASSTLRVEATTDTSGPIEFKSPMLLTVPVPGDLPSKPRAFVQRRKDSVAVKAGAVWDRKKATGFLMDEPDPRVLYSRFHTTETSNFVCDKARVTDVWLDFRRHPKERRNAPKFVFDAHVRLSTEWYRQDVDLEIELPQDPITTPLAKSLSCDGRKVNGAWRLGQLNEREEPVQSSQLDL